MAQASPHATPPRAGRLRPNALRSWHGLICRSFGHNRSNLRKMAKPTFWASRKNISNILVKEFCCIRSLPILLDVGHDGSVRKYKYSHVLLFDCVGIFAISVVCKIALHAVLKIFGYGLWPMPNWSPARTGRPLANTTSSSFSLCTCFPVSSSSVVTIRLVLVSMTSPVEG